MEVGFITFDGEQNDRTLSINGNQLSGQEIRWKLFYTWIGIVSPPIVSAMMRTSWMK